MTDEEIKKLPQSYYTKRCRRYIPPPIQLARRLKYEAAFIYSPNLSNAG